MNQRTIAQPVSLRGVGLHTGKHVSVTFKPAVAGEGLRFVRIDLGGKMVRVAPETTVMDPAVTRCTAVEEAGVRVYTIEHLLAAVAGLGIDNLTVAINGEEVPGLDGSSREFVEALKRAGIVEQNVPKEFVEIDAPITVSTGHSSVTITPAKDFQVAYTLDYDHPALRSQLFASAVTQDAFERDIAPARTFAWKAKWP